MRTTRSNEVLLNEKPVISLRELLFRYPDSPAPVLDIHALDVMPGEQVLLHGDSGSGKSTLLDLISGILPLQQGHIKLLDIDLGSLSTRKRDRFRAFNVGIVFQQFNLIPYLSVLDNILLAARLGKGLSSSVALEADHMLRAVQMDRALYHQKADRLSFGQQQRVAIVRALINRPSIVLLDEPTSALDTTNRDEFMALLKEQTARFSTTLVFVSHDRDLACHFSRTLTIGSINRVVTP